jgi:hypothetical protein
MELSEILDRITVLSAKLDQRQAQLNFARTHINTISDDDVKRVVEKDLIVLQYQIDKTQTAIKDLRKLYAEVVSS